MITVEKAYEIAKMVKEICIKLDSKCYDCPFIDDPYCKMAAISGARTPDEWEFPSYKPQDEHIDESNEDEGIIRRIAALERQVEGLKGITKSQTIVIDNHAKHLDELHSKVYALEKWRKS